MTTKLLKKSPVCIILTLMLAFAVPSFIKAQQADNETKSNYEINNDSIPKDTSDRLQFLNRCDWRVKNVIALVNKWQTDNDFRLISMELDSLIKLIDESAGKFAPENKKDEVIKNGTELKASAQELIALSNDKKRDDIKAKSNEFFAKYAKFKFGFREKTIKDMQ